MRLGRCRYPADEPALTAFPSSGVHKVSQLTCARGMGLWGQLGEGEADLRVLERRGLQ